jgi:hypothetical protein
MGLNTGVWQPAPNPLQLVNPTEIARGGNMRKLTLLSLLTLLLFAVAARADSLYFYGGDMDPNDPNSRALANETDLTVTGDPYGAATYQNFYVQGSAITTTALFTNNLSTITPTSGYWEIRSGLSEGNGGTLIASGTDPNITHTLTGRSRAGYDEYTDQVSASVNLAVGQYWFAVVPACPTCDGRSFNSNTFGLNSVGTSDSDLQYANSSYFGWNFTNADNTNPPYTFPNFSNGVYVTPEPGSLLLLGTGILGGLGVLRRKLF